MCKTGSTIGAVRLNLENGTDIGYGKNPATPAHTKRSRVVFDACKTTVGTHPTFSEGVRWMASVGTDHSCPPAQSPVTQLQIRRELYSSGEMECMLIENEIVDAGSDDEAIEVQQTPMLLRSDADRPNWGSNTMLRLDMPNIERGVMRA